jgi:sialate O-acetylesterase
MEHSSMHAARVALTATIALASFSSAAHAQLRLHGLLGDRMVLQRDTDVVLSGKASREAEILVEPSWGGGPLRASVDAAGEWAVAVRTPGAGGPHTIKFSGDGEIALSDVYCGEVWLCSGQSNMEWSVAQFADPVFGEPGGAEEVANANWPQVRLFNTPNRISTYPRRDAVGEWESCSPQSVGDWSATAYYFGRMLHRELGVPIGLVTADWGGTRIEAWMSSRALAPFAQFSSTLEYLAVAADPNARLQHAREHGASWWDRVDGAAPAPLPAGWSATDFDASSWSTMTLPAAFAGEDLGRFDGFVYLRTVVDVPASFAGKGATLELGPIDDRDDAWFDGKLVGSTREDGRWNAARRYKISAEQLAAGPRAIAVRVLDTGGTGGVNGAREQMLLRSDDAALEPLSLAGEWRYRVGARMSELPPMGQSTIEIGANTPSVLFNGMLAPLKPLQFRGAIWYQGESNVGEASAYRRLFPALIEDWREFFQCGDFPLYFVQIAPFEYRAHSPHAAAELREAQRLALRVPNIGMAVTMDIGLPRDIHPGAKQQVGRRLALWALEKTYARDVLSHTGPLFREARAEGSKLRVEFDGAEGGLEIRGGALRDIWIADEDKRFFGADAQVEGDVLVLSHPNVAKPVAARYGWKNASTPNLFNVAKLPASSFRTDDWELGDAIAVEDGGATSSLARDREFKPLYNGRDLSGWVNVNGAPSTWIAKADRIWCSGTPTGVLRTEKQYENFELELEWRHLARQGNAGLFVWSDPVTARGQPFTRSIEVQVMSGMEGDGYTSDGDVFPIHGATMKPHNARGGGSRAFPSELRAKPSGEWNHYRVRCVNGELELAVNGKVVTRGSECSPRKGYICLESEGTPVEFRNLRIKELPPSSPPLPAQHVAELDRGFRSLYNGVDFAGWKFGAEHQGHWRANDWTIDFDGQGADLWSREEFGDFVLIADWRWSGPATPKDLAVIQPDGAQALGADGKPLTARVLEAGDSGIYLRGSSKSQVNIWCWPIGSGEVYGYRTDAAMSAEVRAGVTPKVAADAPLGEWNRFVITMKGDRLTVVLNDQLVIDNAQLPGVAPRGPIALQMHGSPIQFANLYVKPLD